MCEFPFIIFLGAAAAAKENRLGPPVAWNNSFVGLSPIVASPIYPMTIRDYSLVFAVKGMDNLVGVELEVVGPEGDALFKTTISMTTESPPVMSFSPKLVKPINILVLEGEPVWQIWSLSIRETGLSPFVKAPGQYTVFLSQGEQRGAIGTLGFLAFELPELSEEDIALIKSSPRAGKTVEIILDCRKCGERIGVYAGLQKSIEKEKGGLLWHEDIPERYVCGCKNLDLELKYIKTNLRKLIGSPSLPNEQLRFTSLYQDSSLLNVASEFEKLISNATKEEELQVFINENPILLNQFSPIRIFPKASILNQRKTDFVILNPKRELVLIELEKPATRLLKKNGGVAAELTHAFDQVTEWLKYVDDHRAAILEDLGLNYKDISNVRGAVIAGRDSPYSAADLLRLKGRDFGRVEFFTYDDLANHLLILQKKMKYA